MCCGGGACVYSEVPRAAPGACECMPVDKSGYMNLGYGSCILSFKYLFTFVYLGIWTYLYQLLC